MKPEPIIEIKNIGKKYNISHHQGKYVTFRDTMAYALKKPFSFMKKKMKSVAGMDTKEEFWALRDITANIYPGEVVGIIGKNGAGKSTLLKILTGITPPTEGEIKMKGKISSLLEVGTGFHPELTGRENIFLNGAILGMKKKEIEKNFDAIVEFAGIEKFLDTPVKHYSSGMYVRLAFSVAAHMEPDILLVDEVLAVGDAEFQKKCLGKMDEITKNSGRTIIFVSHNMAAIQDLCSRVILLENGKVQAVGPTQKIIEGYLRKFSEGQVLPLPERTDRKGSGDFRFTKIEVTGAGGKSDIIETGKPFHVKVHYRLAEKIESMKNISFSFTINDPLSSKHLLAFWTETSGSNFNLKNKEGVIECNVDLCPLTLGDYYINLYATENGIVSDYVMNVATIHVDDTEYFSKGVRDHESHPKYVTPHTWKIA